MYNFFKRIEKIIRKNACEQKKKKPGLIFNPGLALIGVRATWTLVLDIQAFGRVHITGGLFVGSGCGFPG